LDPILLSELFFGDRDVVDDEKITMTIRAGKSANVNRVKPTRNLGSFAAVRAGDHWTNLATTGYAKRLLYPFLMYSLHLFRRKAE
jgi:hypothetical protein